MASTPAGRDVRPESAEASRPEPACLEAQKWIEAVTGKSFGDKDFRSALENGILLCELLSAIRPGLVKKINRLPTPIAGLDNLSVFLRGCEELGLKGSQLFDPGDLQDTSIRANLKDSDCSRKLKNVLNTVFWLAKAAGGCASYSGPTLDLKEFEALLANMKVDSDEAADGSQKRSVRDSGYDCWDSERSDSLSPPRHTRDNSLDSLDSFGSRSQHSPSPDVANRGNVEASGRDGDPEADGGRRPDVQKDDMSARRAASGEARTPVLFNQFLPNRSSAGFYALNAKRRPHAEDREQRSPAEGKKSVTWAGDHQNQREICERTRIERLEKAGVKVLPAALRYGSPSSPSTSPTPERPASPNIILRRDNDFLNSQKSAWDSSSDSGGEAEGQKVPDIRKDDLASRRAPRGPAVPRVHQFVMAAPLLECSSKDHQRWEGIRRSSHKTLKDISELEQIPDIITRQKEDEEEEDEREEEGAQDAARVKAKPDKQMDDLALRRARTRPRPLCRDRPMSLTSAPMSQADVQKWERLRMSEPSEPDPVPVCQACRKKTYAGGRRGRVKSVRFGGVTEMGRPIGVPESGLLGPLRSQATVAVPTIGLGSLLSEREGSLTDGGQPSQVTSPGSPEVPRSPAELDAGLAQYERNLKEEEEEEDEEERIPDIHKDDMMARRTGVFHKQSASSASYNRFLPLPASKYKAQVTDPGAKEVEKNIRAEEGIIPIEHSPQSPDESKNDDDANEPLANPKKDDMMVRRKRWIEKSSPGFRQFLPVPAGVLQNNTVQSCATKQTAKRVEKMASESGGLRPLEKPPKKEIVDEQKEKTANVTNVASSQPRLDDVLPPSEEAGLGKVNKMADPPTTKDSWVGDDDLPPMMSSRRVALMSEDPESVSMSDMVDQDEAGHLPQLSLSRYERMHEQYNDFQDEDDQWQSDLARWKNRRRCASQELIKKEEERKRMERMNGEAGDKRKSIKTYKEIVEDKERREAELCEAYRSAATPEEAAMVLQRYALRFTISDATLDFLNLPRPAANPDATRKTVCEDPEPQSTQRKTCEDLRRRAEKDPPTSELSPKSHQPPGPASPSKPEAATKADAEPRPKPPKPKPSPKPALPSTLPPPPVKPVPLLAAKPYRQPSSTRGVKMDGLVRVNGDTETSPLRSPSEKKLLVTQAEKETSSTSESRDTSPPPQPATASSSSSSSSASSSSTISSLFSGRNCVTKTTIVTELTQTLVEPHAADGHSQVTVEKAAEGKPSLSSSTSITSMHCPSVSDGQDESSMSIETPMLNLAKRVNHWVWDPNEERKRVERWQQEQERFLKEQYQKEQEKLKKEWEKAQLEVQEEERKHNEEERKILEETVAPLSPCVRTTSPPAGDKTTSIPPQQNGHKDTKGSEEQHASRLQFLQDAAYDSEPAKKSEMWKTASLDRNTQPNAPHGVKRCDSHDGIAGTGTQQPSSPLPPSPSRCVSGKRQCSGCSQPLGKGAAMIIETLGLYFHMQCFKCGLCEGQLGDATAGTDVRIRNGLLSCHHCYLATRGQGQPTTL
ncbi:LIM and calponin homology domains-containing protein 1a isoform X1 [Syngnathus typhle]|uniref:LIM and calponin homology domains-containing protein 1a isoform X1 n=1 Tax=Syngnathus typhle TaxID=161592 RepID=UPI002A699C07|nr:LIM and calponin homology domains-containing protein 1a isoform X1 [Syngnathus typhle]